MTEILLKVALNTITLTLTAMLLNPLWFCSLCMVFPTTMYTLFLLHPTFLLWLISSNQHDENIIRVKS
jgi:hypothetical protein